MPDRRGGRRANEPAPVVTLFGQGAQVRMAALARREASRREGVLATGGHTKLASRDYRAIACSETVGEPSPTRGASQLDERKVG